MKWWLNLLIKLWESQVVVVPQKGTLEQASMFMFFNGRIHHPHSSSLFSTLPTRSTCGQVCLQTSYFFLCTCLHFAVLHASKFAMSLCIAAGHDCQLGKISMYLPCFWYHLLQLYEPHQNKIKKIKEPMICRVSLTTL